MRVAMMTMLVSALAAPAMAQGTGFVSLRGFLDADGTHVTGLPAAAGIGVSAGIDVSKHVSLVIELDEPMNHSQTTTGQTLDPVKGTQRFTVTRIARTPSFNVLVAVRGLSDRRVGFAVSGGVGWSDHHDSTGSTIETLGPGGTVTGTATYPQTGSGYTWLGLAGGVEIPIRVTRHLSIAPELRGVWFPASESGRTIVRSGAAVRWTF